MIFGCSEWGRKRTARFEPKALDTLRPEMRELIGRVFEWDFVGTSDDDEPYPGQTRWLISRKHDHALADDQKGRWVPGEDLQDVS